MMSYQDEADKWARVMDNSWDSKTFAHAFDQWRLYSDLAMDEARRKETSVLEFTTPPKDEK